VQTQFSRLSREKKKKTILSQLSSEDYLSAVLCRENCSTPTTTKRRRRNEEEG